MWADYVYPKSIIIIFKYKFAKLYFDSVYPAME